MAQIARWVGLGIILFCIAFFQNCNKTPNASSSASLAAGGLNTVNPTSNATETTLSFLPSALTVLSWSQTSGTVSPDDQYGFEYTVYFAQSKFTVASHSGSQAPTTVPAAETKALTPDQMGKIQNLLLQVTYVPCAAGSPLAGGATDHITLEFSTPAAMQLYNSSCMGIATSTAVQTTGSGYSAVTAYLKTLY